MEPRSGQRGTTYSLVREYVHPDGLRQRFTTQGSSSHPRMDIGETVPVKFDPAHPERARVDRPFQVWGLPGFFLLMGAMFLATAGL